MFELVKEIPVTFEPHWADKWLVGATIASVITSGAVAVLAWLTSRSAKSIANEANRTQKALHSAQAIADYKARLDSSLAQLIRRIREYYGPLDDWLDDADQVEIGGKTDPVTNELSYPKDPPFSGIVAEIEVARMIANADDGMVLAEAHSALKAIEGTYLNKRWDMMLDFISVIRLWRSTQIEAPEASHSFHALKETALKKQHGE